MNWGENLRLAWGSLLSNRLRSFLTILGVTIGVASVIALVSVGRGMNVQIMAQVESLGANLLTVMPLRGVNLLPEDAEVLARRVEAVRLVAPAITTQAPVKAGEKTYDTQVEGVTEAAEEVRNYQVTLGRFITREDVAARRNVAVVGQEILRQLGRGAGLGQTIAIAGRPFTVVGVLAPKGSVFGRNQDDVVFIPLSVAPLLAGTRFLSVIYMSARSGEEAGLAAAHALAVLRHRHPQASGDDPVRILSQDQLLSMMRSTNQLVTLFLGAVAGISLLVGGIGIMNIMLVSVTERTREIGIRMAVGARPGDILGQFLTESVLLSFTGGLVGVALGLSSARWIARIIGSVPLVVPSAVVAALGLAVAVGLFFGVYPAWKASRLDPIVALRHE